MIFFTSPLIVFLAFLDTPFYSLVLLILLIFDLADTTNEIQIKGEQQLKYLTDSVELISARFDEYEADRKKKRGNDK